jgi:hypothetical protein
MMIGTRTMLMHTEDSKEQAEQELGLMFLGFIALLSQLVAMWVALDVWPGG